MTFSRRDCLKLAATTAVAALTPGAASVMLRARVLQSPFVAGNERPRQSAQREAGPLARTRIDTHHHVFPPPYIAALIEGKQDAQIAQAWSVARTLDDMERAGVDTSIASLTQPAVTFAPSDVARRVARESNEWVAKLVADNRGRFGSFATLPMPDVDGTLREIGYALDTLKADGVCLLTS